MKLCDEAMGELGFGFDGADLEEDKINGGEKN